MTKSPKTKRLLINILIVTVLVGGTLAAVQYAKGYRPNLKSRQIQGTGLLSITSYPKAARVIINDKLTTVTDDKLYLTPTTYNIKIEKDGFHPWLKSSPIKPELVTSIDARLFPIISATTPITFYSVTNPSVNPEGSKIAYVLQNSPVDTDNGLYVYSLTNNLLGSQSVQITSGTKDYSTAKLIWSPDSSQILVLFTEKPVPTKISSKITDRTPTEKIVSSQLLSTKSMNQTKNANDVTYRLPLIVSEWQDQNVKLNLPTLTLYPKYISTYLTKNATNVYFSPDKERVFYTAKENLNLPENDIAKTLPNINSSTETRNLQKDSTYVFDLKEGTNYIVHQAAVTSDIAKTLIIDSQATPSATIDALNQIKAQTDSRFTTNLSWYGNRQLIISDNNGVNIIDYDGLNLVNITGASVLDNFIVPAPDGSKLIVLTNINQKADVFNLISFDLK